VATKPTETKAHPVLWTVGAVVAAVAVIIILGTVHTEGGDPVIKNPELLITQILITAGVIGAATLPLLIKTQRDAAVAREQVANDHIDTEGKQINLRVEQDERHGAVVDLVTEKFDDLTKHFNVQFDGVRSDIRGIRSDVGRNTNRIQRTSDKLETHLDESREIIKEFRGEIGELHRLNVQYEDSQEATTEETQQEEPNGNPR
jgi:hypothetical protein